MISHNREQKGIKKNCTRVKWLCDIYRILVMKLKSKYLIGIEMSNFLNFVVFLHCDCALWICDVIDIRSWINPCTIEFVYQKFGNPELPLHRAKSFDSFAGKSLCQRVKALHMGHMGWDSGNLICASVFSSCHEGLTNWLFPSKPFHVLAGMKMNCELWRLVKLWKWASLPGSHHTFTISSLDCFIWVGPWDSLMYSVHLRSDRWHIVLQYLLHFPIQNMPLPLPGRGYVG